MTDKMLSMPVPVLWILDEDGRTPIPTDDVLKWGELLEDGLKRQVAIDYSDDMNICVSTVFMGINQFLVTPGIPALFQTVVFRKHVAEGPLVWKTWEEAEAGHATTCKELGISVKGFK